MSQYAQLADHLRVRKGDQWTARFEEVEQVLGRPLPGSAYRHAAWWANQEGSGHSQVRGWRDAGWRTAGLSLSERRVRFERVAPGEHREASTDPLEALFEQAAALCDTSDRSALTELGLRALISHAAEDHLVALGGADAAFVPGARERPSA